MVRKPLQDRIGILKALFVLLRFVEFDHVFEEVGFFFGEGAALACLWIGGGGVFAHCLLLGCGGEEVCGGDERERMDGVPTQMDDDDVQRPQIQR